MVKTGRPPTSGRQPGWMLLRATVVLEAFNKARETGEKYEFALEAAVDAVHAFDPEMKVSVSAVKRILKELMPEGAELMLNVTKVSDKTDTANETATGKTSYGIGFAPRAQYPHPSKRNK